MSFVSIPETAQRSGLLFAGLCALNGAFVPAVAKFTTDRADPLFVAAVTTLFAGLAAAVMLGVRGELSRLVRRETAPLLILLGALGTTIPFILFFTLMGAYIGQNNATELLILVGFGVAATILRFADYPLAPLLIGFILGRMLEDNFSRAMQLYDGPAFLWERPMTTGLLILAMGLIFLPAWRARRAKARAEGVADGD